MTGTDTVYYVANTSSAFEDAYILCADDKPICVIQCHDEDSCSGTTINATLSKHLYLECNDRNSCQEITVYGPTNSSNIQCNEFNSCRFGDFHFADTISVQMYCGGPSGQNSYSCSSLNIDVSRSESVDIQCTEKYSCDDANINGTFVTDSINIFCNESQSCASTTVYGSQANQVNAACNGDISGSCYRINLYCPSKRKNQCNIDCGSGTEKVTSVNVHTADNFTVGFMNVTVDSCSSSECPYFNMRCLDSGTTTSYYHQTEMGTSYCSDYDCCPITDYKLDNQCNAGEDCIINCTQSDPFGINCESSHIDSSRATSLTLYCQSYRACWGTRVLCPFGGECNVVCQGDSACRSLAVNSSLSMNTNLSCGAGESSCQHMQLYATNNTNVNVVCHIGSNCLTSWMYVSNSENVNIICDGPCSSYGYARISAYNTTRTDISCTESSSCDLHIYGMGSDAVYVNCEAPGSCDLLLHCPNEENSCHLNCKDTESSTGSCGRSRIYLDGEYLSDYEHSNVLNLSCPSNAYDCAGIVFDCEQYGSNTGSQRTAYDWNPFTQKYDCVYPTCCPIYTDILCEAGKDCHIECNDTGAVSCSNTIINAKDATSLTVDCVDGLCGGAHFECPLASNASCNVNCEADKSCRYSKFNGNGATDINIQCTASHQACDNMQINIASENNLVNLNCSSCNDIEFINYGANSISNISCDYCDDIEFINYGANSISNISCDYCRSSEFKFNLSKSISVECINDYSCSNVIFSGGSGGDVAIECNSLSSCYSTRLKFSQVDSFVLKANVNNTFGTGSSYLYPPVHIQAGTHIYCGEETACDKLGIQLPTDLEFEDDWLVMECDSPSNVCSDININCWTWSPYGWWETTLSSTDGEYICNPASESMICCPFGGVNVTQSTPSPERTDVPSSVPTETMVSSSPTGVSPSPTHVPSAVLVVSSTHVPTCATDDECNDDEANTYIIGVTVWIGFVTYVLQ
eukprot:167769_1